MCLVPLSYASIAVGSKVLQMNCTGPWDVFVPRSERSDSPLSKERREDEMYVMKQRVSDGWMEWAYLPNTHHPLSSGPGEFGRDRNLLKTDADPDML